MTAALGNTAQGTPFATGVDAFVYPQFIGYALRAPSTQDIYNPGTRWQDNSVNPPVQYYTVGAGLWYQTANTAFGVSSVSGTANQITAAPTTGNVVLSIPAAFIAPGSIASTTTVTSGTSMVATTTLTAGTGITSTTGNIVASAGNINATLGSMSAGTSITAGTSLTATLGNITATNGNIVRTAAGNKDVYGSVGTTTAAGANSAGTVTLVGGTATVATTAITAASQVRLYRQGVGATGAAALGFVTLGTKTAGVSFVINAVQVANATALQASDVSVIGWEIVN